MRNYVFLRFSKSRHGFTLLIHRPKLVSLSWMHGAMPRIRHLLNSFGLSWVRERANYAKDLCSLAVASPRLFIIPFVSKSLIHLLRNLGDVPVDLRPIILLNKIQRRQYAAAAGLSHLTHYLHFRLSSIQQIVRSRALGFEFRALAPLGHPTGSLSDSERASRIIQQHEIR